MTLRLALKLAAAFALATAPALAEAQTAKENGPLQGVVQPLPAPSAPGTVQTVTRSSNQATGSDTVTIGAPGAVKGAVTINGAAGTNNQQANAGVIASGGNALALGNILQLSESTGLSGGGSARAAIAPGTLAGSNGWVAVSGAAGADNQQVNLAVMALGIEGLVVSDTTLAQARASTKPMGENGAADASPSRSVAIGQGAFRGSSGVVQLSLVGGDRNTSANTFALLVAGSAGPE